MTNFSIIIPTLNHAGILTETLNSVLKQSFDADKFEILVIDNGSTDNTREVTEAIAAKYPGHRLSYIYEPEPGLLSGRHRGALEACGEIFIFIDDDIKADKEWMSGIYESFKDPSVQLVGGRNLPEYEEQPPQWLDWFWSNHPYGRYCCYLSLLDFGDTASQIDANYIWGLNFSIRRKAFFDLGGFHPDFVPKHLQYLQGDGETGLTIKANELGYKAIYQPLALIFHKISAKRMTYKYFDQRSFYTGVAHSFTDIRKKGEPYEPSTLKQEIKKILRDLKQQLLSRFRRKRLEQYLNERFHRHLIAGYQFHQRIVRNNPSLLSWVLRDDYWDYKLPKFSVKKW